MPALQPISYLFLDGECLNQTLVKMGDRYFGGAKPALEWARVRVGHRKVFYYDAVPVQNQGEDDATYSARVWPKEHELAEIARQSGFHVRTGEARRRRGRGNEQKMVDVQLAVDALLMASRGLFSACTLLTGDLDFKPLIDALVEMGIDVRLLYPQGETTDELKAAADQADPFAITTVRDWGSDDVRRPLPMVAINMQGFASTADPSIVEQISEWKDDRYGECRVGLSGGAFVLITKCVPQSPNTHYLLMSATDAGVLRAYAEDVFGLHVPVQ